MITILKEQKTCFAVFKTTPIQVGFADNDNAIFLAKITNDSTKVSKVVLLESFETPRSVVFCVIESVMDNLENSVINLNPSSHHVLEIFKAENYTNEPRTTEM